jgi:hypothetical protein
MPEEGGLSKLKIEAFLDLHYRSRVDGGLFEAMFNPNTYALKYEAEYEEAQGQGTTGSPQRFVRIKPQEFRFDLVFDGTGVSSRKAEVADEIESFLRICGKNNGDIHRPNHLEIRWGTLIARCVLKSAEITYNLFKPNGHPLRAKVAATFAENVEENRRVREADNSSPDLTHYRVVLEGDTLPLMTHRIYGNAAYYPEIARVNGLTQFRSLQPGTTLFFPPLRQTGPG